MFILDIKPLRTKCGRAAAVHIAAAVFCLIFTAVYEIFSYGEHSDSMRNMYLVPLIGGGAVFALMYAARADKCLSRFAFNAWNSGIALVTSGCLMQGIVEISGRSFEYGGVYLMLGGCAMMLGFIMQCITIQCSRIE